MSIKFKVILQRVRAEDFGDIISVFLILHTYWQIGKIIVEDEALHIGDVEYEKQSLRQLSKVLTTEFGKGFSRSNLSNMRQFYLTHKDVQTVSGQLSWSHYCELQAISDEQKRSFYEKECINARWSIRELRRQIESSLFERLLLSSGNANKEKVMSLAVKGNEIAKPADIIRDPYVFEFLRKNFAKISKETIQPSLYRLF